MTTKGPSPTARGPLVQGRRVAEPSYLTAVRESSDTVAADYMKQVKRPADLDPLPTQAYGGQPVSYESHLLPLE